MLEQLQSALEAAFSVQTLGQMVKYKLGRDLDNYAALPGVKRQVIFELLEAAEREGFLEKLIVGARTFNPDNEKLLAGLASTDACVRELSLRLVAGQRNNETVNRALVTRLAFSQTGPQAIPASIA